MYLTRNPDERLRSASDSEPDSECKIKCPNLKFTGQGTAGEPESHGHDDLNHPSHSRHLDAQPLRGVVGHGSTLQRCMSSESALLCLQIQKTSKSKSCSKTRFAAIMICYSSWCWVLVFKLVNRDLAVPVPSNPIAKCALWCQHLPALQE